jgi:hypothetical protein
MKIRPVGAELFHAEGRTDRRTVRQTYMKKLIVSSRSFAYASKVYHIVSSFPKLKFVLAFHTVR